MHSSELRLHQNCAFNCPSFLHRGVWNTYFKKIHLSLLYTIFYYIFYTYIYIYCCYMYIYIYTYTNIYIYTYIGPMVPFRLPGPELRYKSSGVFRIQTSDVRGPFRTPNPRKSQKKWSVRKLFTLLGHFLKMFEKCSKIHLTYVPIYSQIHRIRIRYSK